MKLIIISLLLAAVTVGVSGLAPQRQVLVTYPKDTPESTIDSAKDAIRAAVRALCRTLKVLLTLISKGGQITAEFSESRLLIEYYAHLLTIFCGRSYQVLPPDLQGQ